MTMKVALNTIKPNQTSMYIDVDVLSVTMLLVYENKVHSVFKYFV